MDDEDKLAGGCAGVNQGARITPLRPARGPRGMNRAGAVGVKEGNANLKQNWMMPTSNRPLEPASEEMRALAARVLDLLVEHAEGLERAPASMNEPSPALLTELSAPPPEMPRDADTLLELAHRAAAAANETAGP